MIDWDRVTELQHEIGEEDFIEVGLMFVSEIREKLGEMELDAAPGAEDYHYLRGSAANLGLVEFAELCGQAEGLARSGGSADLHLVRDSFERSVTEMSAIFEG